MSMSFAQHTFMSKKNVDSISPYLQRRLRPFKEAQREQAQDKKRPDRRKTPSKAVPRDPLDKASPDDPNDR